MITEQAASATALSYLGSWGTHSIPPASLATLVLTLHARPVQYFPLLFVPALFGATWLHLDGRHRDGAALTASSSGLYALLAWRRRPAGGLRARFFSTRGMVRGVALGLAMVNCAAGTWTYLTRSAAEDERQRKEADRWGKVAAEEKRKK